MSEFKTLILAREGGRCFVTLNRPEVRNAIDATMGGELMAVFESLAEDRAVRAIVLRGAGGHFCAGGDIKERKAQGEAELRERNERGGRLFQTIDNMPQAVVAVVEGAALGGGLGMACVADVTIVHKDARFGMPETTLGIPPAQIAPYVVRRIGLTQARRLAVTAARFDGVEAQRLGIAHFVADDTAGLEARLDEILGRIEKCGPEAIAATKAIMLEVGTLSADQQIESSARRFAAAVASEEGREGHAAFAERRPPLWASG